jgi:glycosyltransferase involved in cell wall biosynthesis
MAGLIVHEWVSRSGGSERVLDTFSTMFPDADIVCLWNDAPGRFAAGRIRESALARTPLRGRKALALAAMPLVWRHLSDDGYDWVLSSSHAFSHQVSAGSTLPESRHFSYVHTPARYLWAPQLDGRGRSGLSRLAAAPLRAIDRTRARSHVNVAANSAFIRDRIRSAWGVDSRVIHPPVEVEELQAGGDWTSGLTDAETVLLDALPTVFLLGASRFIPYKRLDVVIRAGEATGMPVVLAGSGPERARLQRQAAGSSATVTFVDSPSDALLRAIMAKASVYIFPAVEDFGIMPVEAMALGTPVVVSAVGGAVESVLDGITGAILAGDSPEELAAAITACLSVDPERCRARARDFGTDRFVSAVGDWMSRAS